MADLNISALPGSLDKPHLLRFSRCSPSSCPSCAHALARDNFEGVGISDVATVLGSTPCRSRIGAGLDQLPGVQPFFARAGQGDDRVCAKRQAVFLVVRLHVAHPPVLAAGGVDFEIEAAAFRELVDLVAGLGGFDPQIGEGLDVSGHDRAIRFFGRAKFDAGYLQKSSDGAGRSRTTKRKKAAVSK